MMMVTYIFPVIGIISLRVRSQSYYCRLYLRLPFQLFVIQYRLYVHIATGIKFQ